MLQRAMKPVLLDLLCQAQVIQNTFFQHLAPAELATVGMPECWAAKDHVAHMTFWRQRLTLRLQAIIREEPQPEVKDYEKLNPLIFEANRHRGWGEILTESDQAYAELIALTSLLTEEDLTTFHRFDWVGDGSPLYIAFMGFCYEHTQNHLAQYLLDRHDLDHALVSYKSWADRVLKAKVPGILKGYVLYNLACFYATHSLLDHARPILQRAFRLYPMSRDLALTDPDLAALRPQPAD